ncbi:unnamed protein product [Amaranthus hypochondriacus]
MSWFGYKGRSSYVDNGHPDHSIERPSHTYVTKIESRFADASHVNIDASLDKYNYGRPREMEDFITQVLDEVHGLPGLTTSPNERQKWGRHSSPVKLWVQGYGSDYHYGSSPMKSKILDDDGDHYDYGVYNPPPQRRYGVPKKTYWDQSQLKSEPFIDHEDPKLKDYPLNRYKSPTKVEILKDYGGPKNHRDKSSNSIYIDHTPKNQYLGVLNHRRTNNRWDNYVGRPRSPNSYEFPSNHQENLSSYDCSPQIADDDGQDKLSQHVHNYAPPSENICGNLNSKWGNSSMRPQPPKEYGLSNRRWNGSSSPVYDHPPIPKNAGAHQYNHRENIIMKHQPSQDHRVSDKQWDRTSSPVHGHPQLGGNIEGVLCNQSRDNSLMKPQLLKDYKFSNKQENKSSNPIGDHLSPTRNYGRVPSNQWDDYLVKSQPSKDYGSFDKQWNRSSSPTHEHLSSISNSDGIPSNCWGNSMMKPQNSKDYGSSNSQFNRSLSPIHDHPFPNKNTEGVPSKPWDNSLTKPQPSKEYEVSNKLWSRPSSNVLDHPPPNKKIDDVPSDQQGNSVMKPQPLKGVGLPNNQWNRSSSLIRDHPPPNSENEKAAGNPLVRPQPPNPQWDRTSSLTYDHSPTKSTNEIPSNQQRNSLIEPQPPNKAKLSNNQWNSSSSPILDHPSPNTNYKGAPISVNPQSPKDHGVPKHQSDKRTSPIYDHLPTGNNNEAPRNQKENTLMKSQPLKGVELPNSVLNRSSSSIHDHLAPNKNIEGALGNSWGNPSMKPQSPNNRELPKNQWDRTSSLTYKDPPSTGNIGGVPRNQWENSSMKP